MAIPTNTGVTSGLNLGFEKSVARYLLIARKMIKIEKMQAVFLEY